jgi:hypothetical protein
MLWLLHDHAKVLAAHEVVVVSILLVVPALLALFILRPGEHALASHMLSGARGVILADALLCACAAAAFGDVLPFRFKDVATTWHAYAVVATVLAGTLIVSWLLALDGAEALRRRTKHLCRKYSRYAIASGLLCLIAAGAVLEAPQVAGRGASQIIWACSLAALGITAGWVSIHAGANRSSLQTIRHRRLFGAATCVSAVVSVGAALLLVEFEFDLVTWMQLRAPLRYAALAAALASVLIEPARRLGYPPSPPEEPEQWVADVQEDMAGEQRTAAGGGSH